jgi:protein SCO1/2
MKLASYLVLVAIALEAGGARAQSLSRSGTSALPPAAREVDIDEHLGQALDGRTRFQDETGRTVVLSDYFHDGKPVLLSLFYYRCPMLCGVLLEGMVKGLRDLDLKLGEHYRVLTVSFDPRDRPEDAARKQESVLAGLARPDAKASWPFLVGARGESEALAKNVGFQFAYDPTTEQYAHPAAIFVLTPDGHISRYLYGVTFTPRDLRLALTEAGGGRTGTIVDRVILTCYRYDSATRRYGPYMLGFIRLGAAAILVSVGSLLAVLLGVERRRRRLLRASDAEIPSKPDERRPH